MADNHFDWNNLLSYFSIDLFNLITAIVATFIVVLCNSSTPINFHVINTIFKFYRYWYMYMLSKVGKNIVIHMKYYLFIYTSTGAGLFR